MFPKTLLLVFILLGLIINSICSPTNSKSSSTASSEKSCCNGASNKNPTQVATLSDLWQQRAVNSFLDSVDKSDIFTPEWKNSNPNMRPSYQQLGRFQCTHSSCAGKSFLSESALERHSRTHSDKRLFKCETCGAVFQSNGSLKTHIQSIHKSSADRPFKCKYCEAHFKSLTSQTRHISGVHKKH